MAIWSTWNRRKFMTILHPIERPKGLFMKMGSDIEYTLRRRLY